MISKKTEAMIPMRDGVRLHTRVFTPTGLQRVPMLRQDPYGIGRSKFGNNWRLHFPS